MIEPVPRLATLTADIVAAYVENNTTSYRVVSRLILHVHSALVAAHNGSDRPSNQRPAEPAVPVQNSVFPNHLVCLECGKSLITLRRHLKLTHNLTPERYRGRWALPFTYPLVAQKHTKHRSDVAKRIGLGRSR